MTPDEIRAAITKLTLELEEAERQAKLAGETVTFKNGKITFDTVSFSYFPPKPEVVAAARNLGIYVDSYASTIKCDAEYWKLSAFEALSSIPNVKIEIDDTLREAIEKWTAPPHLYAEYNKEHTFVVFNVHPKASSQPLYSRCDLHQGYNKYVLNISSLAELKDIIDDYDKIKSFKHRIVIHETVQADLNALLEKNAKLEAITSGDGSNLEPIVLNGIALRNFQVQAVEALKHNDGSGIIAIEMGLGKTPVALAYMKWYWDNIKSTQKFLIIGPASLRPNWTKEINKFLTEPVYQLINTEPSSNDVQHLIVLEKYRVFYMNYDILGRGLKVEEKDPHTGSISTRTSFPWPPILTMAELKLVMDEAHYIKNPDSARTKAINECKFLSAALLTGTPMKNGPGELYPLVRTINKEFAGSYNNWLAIYTYGNGKTAKNPERLRKLLAPIMFRRKKSDVIKDLPPINRIQLEVELSEKAKAAYNQVLLGFYNELEKWDGTNNGATEVQNMLVELMRMKQICSADKVEFVAKRAIETYDSDESDYRKVIIFSQFANEPPIVKRIHDLLGGESLMFTGSDSVYERQDIVDQFQNDPTKHFLVCSTKAASEGLNITAAGHIIFVDLMWTPSDHAQAEGRAYGRLADLHSITSTYVIAENTVEDHIIGILARKFDQTNRVIDGIELTGGSIVNELLGQLKNLRLLK